MSLKAQIEAIVYVAEEPVTLEQLKVALGAKDAAKVDAAETTETAPELPLEPVGPTTDEIRAALYELMADYRADTRGIEVKEVAGGFKIAPKPEHHEVVRKFVKSLKPPIRL